VGGKLYEKRFCVYFLPRVMKEGIDELGNDLAKLTN
jgi:hypothetical protein